MSDPSSPFATSSFPDGPALSVAAVAKRVGVAPATLRTWDRRYSLGPTAHEAGQRRRYGPEDVQRLLIMRSLTLEGVAPADAARIARQTRFEVDEPGAQSDSARAAGEGATSANAPGQGSGADGDGDPAPAAPGRGGERGPVRPRMLRALPPLGPGTLSALGQQDPLPETVTISDIVDAAVSYDLALCASLVRVRDGQTIEDWWEELAEPALGRVATRTTLSGPGEAPTLVVKQAVLAALRAHAERVEAARQAAGDPPPNHPSRLARLALVVSDAQDAYVVRAHAFGEALAAHAIAPRIMTGPVSREHIIDLVGLVRPTVVVIVAGATSNLSILADVTEAHPGIPVYVSVPTGVRVPLLPRVRDFHSFTGLVREVVESGLFDPPQASPPASPAEPPMPPER